LDDRLPREIAPEIGHTMQNLVPFYVHLENVTDMFRAESISGSQVTSKARRAAANIAKLPKLLKRLPQ
jgi:hypothetical protein